MRTGRTRGRAAGRLSVQAAIPAPYVQQGHCLVASDGGVFNFGDGTFQGSLGAEGRPDIVHIGAKP
ncbi:MAG: hypothetical protein QOD62_1040 [Actinomycetota bacterium]|jgi:hypothetical protein|nr:hypothetical protein [Actinomycetota bacterium]